MDDTPTDGSTALIDRLALVALRPGRDLDLDGVRTGARRRRQRRSAGMGLAAVALLAVGGLGAGRLLADGDPGAREITTAGPAPSVVDDWGGPVDLDVGDGALYVTLAERWTTAGLGQAGVARLDPASGELEPITEVEPNAAVAYGAGSLWVAQPAGRWVDRLDPGTGERLDRVDVSAVAPPTVEPAWHIAAGPRSVWLVGDYEGNGVVRIDVETLTPTFAGRTGQVLTAPLVIGDDLWFGEADGLRRVTATAGLQRFTGPETGRRVTALAGDGQRLWFAHSEGAGAASTLSYIEPSSGVAGAAFGGLLQPGGVEALGAVGPDLCADVGGDNTTAGIRCGTVARTTGRIALDRVLPRDEEAIDGSGLLPFDGHLWGVRWVDGVVLQIDPATADVEAVVDLPFDGMAAIEQQMEPVGEERLVASGELPRGGGQWAYYAFEAAAGYIGTRFESPLGGYGSGPGELTAEQVLTVGYSSGGSTGLPNDAQANVTPEVDRVRFELVSGEVVEVVPVDVGFEIEFVYTFLPDGVGVDRAVALDGEGRVLGTAEGFVPIDGG